MAWVQPRVHTDVRDADADADGQLCDAAEKVDARGPTYLLRYLFIKGPLPM